MSSKKENKKVAVKAVDPFPNENHQQMFLRLGGGPGPFTFAHGTPQARVKKSH